MENINEKPKEQEVVQICSECKERLVWSPLFNKMSCPMGCTMSVALNAIHCNECGKDVPFGKAHICSDKTIHDTRWQHLTVQLEGEEAPPTIEEYEEAVHEHDKTITSRGVSSKLPAEMVERELIIVGERFRKEYRNIEQLADSIKSFGLMQYPVIDEDNNLIAGGRRMRALELLNWKWVPVVRKKNISELKLREMELEENIQREDLSWAEQVALKDEVYKLKVRLYGEKGTGRAAAARAELSGAVSKKDVAEIFGDSPSNFTLDLQLARALKDIPELAQCASKDEARKKLKQMQEKLIVDELEKRHRERTAEQDLRDEADASDNGRPRESSLYGRAEKAFIVVDAIQGLKSLPTGTPFGFVNVDTPYGIDLNATKKTDPSSVGKIIEDNYIEWDKAEFLEKCRAIAEEVFRIVDNCFMTWWFAEQWQQDLFQMLTEVGWKVDPVPCIWYTGLQGQTNQPEIYLARTYEPFFVCRKGQPIINKRGRSNVFHFAKLTADKKIHPTEKPTILMEELYATFAPIGCSILVPFLGSGNDLLAAYKTGRDGLGFDLNSEVKKRFLLRVAEFEGFKR